MTLHDETTRDDAMPSDATRDQTMRDETMRDETMRDETMRDEAPDDREMHDRTTPAGGTGAVADGDTGAMSDDLFGGEDAALFRERWQKVQARFVDDPQGAVQDADSLVSDVTQSLTSHFAEQKTTLEQQWSSGDGVDTENLRMTLQRYRTLFERLLAA